MCQFRYNSIESTLDQVPGDFHLKITKLLLKYDSNEFQCQNFKSRRHPGNAFKVAQKRPIIYINCIRDKMSIRTQNDQLEAILSN
jgi:hypothetical protein